MATDSTNLPQGDLSFDAGSDMASSDFDPGAVQVAAAADTPQQIQIPRGQQVVLIPVKPGDTLVLPTDSADGLLAKIGAEGNLAIVVDGRTIIFQGYVQANEESPVKIVTNDGDVIDITEVVADTIPGLDIQTAAGPAAGAAAGALPDTAGNGIFVPFAAGPLLGGLDAIGVLGPTQLAYRLITDERIIYPRGLEEDGKPGGIEISPVVIDEDDLTGGNADGPGDEPDPATTKASGSMVADFGPDGPRAIDPYLFSTIVNGSESGLFALSGGADPTLPGSPILLQLDPPAGGSQVLKGYVGGTTYFTITLDTSTGNFVVRQFEPLFHPDENNTEDNVPLNVKFTGFDATNDPTAEGTLNISFDDDSPELTTGSGGITLRVDESVGGFKVDFDDKNFPNDGIQDGFYIEDDEVFLLGGLPQALKDIDDPIGVGFANASVLFVADYGADGAAAADSELYSLTILNAATGLIDTATQQAITLFDNAGVIEGRNGNGDVVFALTIDPATGQVSMAQYRAIDHGDEEPFPGAHDETAFLGSGHLAATLTITDGDGDQASLNVDIGESIGIEDDGPVFQTVDFGKDQDSDGKLFGLIDEDALPDGIGDNAPGDQLGGTVVDGVINFDFGSDIPATLSIDDLTVKDSAGNVIALGDLHTSDGRDITINKSTDPGTGVITWAAVVAAGEVGAGAPVFTFTLDGSGTGIGAFEFELHQALEHLYTDIDLQSDGPDTTYEDDLHFDFTVIGTDGDGDEATGHINILVDDDSPTIQQLDAAINLAVDETVADKGTGDVDDPDFVFPQDGTREEDDETLETLPTVLTNIGAVIGAATDDASKLFSFDFGADGGATTGGAVFALKIIDEDTGLTDTQSGDPIVLIEDNGVILGVADDGNPATDDPVVFALTIDPDTGLLSMAQYRAVHHGDEEGDGGAFDEVVSLGAEILAVTLTVTDADGDSVAAERDIGGGITFDDDGPTFVSVEFGEDGDSSNSIGIIDEDELPTGNKDSAAGDNAGGTKVDGVINFDFGSDGPSDQVFGALTIGALDYTIRDSAGNSIAPLALKTVDGQSLVITTSFVGGFWSVEAKIFGGPENGTPVFLFRIDAEGDGIGEFTFELFRALEHPYTDEDFNNDGKDSNGDPQTAYEDNLVFDFRVVATDGDGDEAEGHIKIDVDDDSPVVTEASGSFLLAVDETVADKGTGDFDDPNYVGPVLDGTRAEDDEHLVALPASLTGIGTVIGAASADASVLFTVNFGADGGAAAGDEVYSLTILDPNTGLTDTQTQEPITLHVNGSVIEGRNTTGDVVFALTVAPNTGLVSMAQYRAIDHGDEEGEGGAFDEVLSLGSGKLAVTLTATDADGDKDSESVDIGSGITFDDDGPTFDETDFNQDEDGDSSNGIGLIDEDALNGGIAGGPGDDDGGLITDGIIKFDFGSDKAGSLSIAALNVTDSAGNVIDLANLHTADGRELEISQSGPDVNGVVTYSAVVAANQTGAGDPVFTFKLDTEGGEIGEFEFELHQALEHPYTDPDFENNGPETEYEDNLLFDFTIIGEDGDGDEAEGHVKISVDDDTPDVAPATSGTISLVTDETVSASNSDFDDPNFAGLPLDGTRPEGDETLVTLPTELSSIATAIGAASANASALFTVSFGADGGEATDDKAYSLTILNSATSLTDTESGDPIILVKDNGLVLGVADDGNPATTDDPVVFAFYIDPDTGLLTMAQYRAVDHGDTEADPGAHDEIVSLGREQLAVTLTVTDADGDQDSETIDIGAGVGFEDDGPTTDLELKSGASLVLDESVGADAGDPNADDEEDSLLDLNDIGYAKILAGDLFTETTDFGSDKEGSPDKAFSLVVNGVAPVLTGLIDTVSGQNVILVDLGGGVVEGRTQISDLTVFKVVIDTATGDVEVFQYRAVEHDDDADHDELTSPETINANTLLLQVTVEDGDGDQDDDAIDLGSIIKFEDDGPTTDLELKSGAQLVLDESVGVGAGDPNANDEAASPLDLNDIGYAKILAGDLFTETTDFGSDKEGTPDKVFSLEVVGVGPVSSGLVDTQSNEDVILVDIGGGVVEGRTETGDLLVFKVVVDTTTGDVEVFQYRAIEHDDPTDPDEDVPNVGTEAETIAAGTLLLKLTVEDGDEDTAEDTIDLGSIITFEDDGPVFTSVNFGTDGDSSGGIGLIDEDALTDGIAGGPGDDAGGKLSNGTIAFDFGSDKAGSLSIDSLKITDSNNVEIPLASLQTVDGQDITIVPTGPDVNGVVTWTAVVAAGEPDAGATVFTFKLDTEGTNIGDFSFELSRPLEHPYTDSDFNNDDNPEAAYEDNLLFDFTITATDGDDDEATGHIKISVDDDSPTAANVTGSISLAVDESVGGSGDLDANGTNGTAQDGSRAENDETLVALPLALTNIGTVIGAATADASGLFTFDFGADGGAATGNEVYTLNIEDPNTGLVDTATGEDILLVDLGGGVIVGRTDTSLAVVFALTIAADGTISMAQYRAINHSDDGLDSYPDEVIALGAEKLSVTLTVTDADGDQASATRDIGSFVTFDDDGPEVTASGTFSLAVDETLGGTGVDVDANGTDGTQQDGSAVENDEQTNLAAVLAAGLSTTGLIGANSSGTSTLFTYDPGSDGEASKGYSLQVTGGGITGLIDTASGLPITLVNVGGGVVQGQIAGGIVVFAIKIDTITGVITMAQYRAVNHTNDAPNSYPDETATMAAGILSVVLTVEDKDGDIAFASQDISGGIVFDDDGPTATDDVKSAGTSGSITGNVLTDAADDSFGSDGKGSPAITKVVFKGVTYTDAGDGSDDGIITVQGDFGKLELNEATGAYTYTRSGSIFDTGLDVFTYTIQDGDGDTDDATLTIDVAAANILNGNFITNTNVVDQPLILTFQQITNPLHFSAKLYSLNAQGQQGTVAQDVGFFIDPALAFLYAVEAGETTNFTNVNVTDFSLEGTDLNKAGGSDDWHVRYDDGGPTAPGAGGREVAYSGVFIPVSDTEVETDQPSSSGDEDANSLTDPNVGDGGLDYLFGAAGNDTLTGGGQAEMLNGGNGSDKLLGGAGNDILVFDGEDVLPAGAFGIADGGVGADVLRIDDGALAIFYGTPNNVVNLVGAEIRNIEVIGLTEEAVSDKNNGTTIRLTAQDVLDFTDDSLDADGIGANTLYIVGSLGDKVQLASNGAGFNDGDLVTAGIQPTGTFDDGQGQIFNIFTISGGGALYVDKDITVETVV